MAIRKMGFYESWISKVKSAILFIGAVIFVLLVSIVLALSKISGWYNGI